MSEAEIIRGYNLWRTTLSDTPEDYEDYLHVRRLIELVSDDDRPGAAHYLLDHAEVFERFVGH